MIDRRWIGSGGTAGILGFPVTLVPVFNANNTLSSDFRTDQITGSFAAHRNGVLAQPLLLVAGNALTPWFGATAARASGPGLAR